MGTVDPFELAQVSGEVERVEQLLTAAERQGGAFAARIGSIEQSVATIRGKLDWYWSRLIAATVIAALLGVVLGVTMTVRYERAQQEPAKESPTSEWR